MFSEDNINEILKKSRFMNERTGYESYNDKNANECITTPLWIEFLNRVIKSSENNLMQDRKIWRFLEQTDLIPFQEILSLFVFEGTKDLFKKNNHIGTHFSENAVLNMQKSLLKRLSKISSETFYVEFCANNIYYIKRFLGQTSKAEENSNSKIEYRNFIEKMLHGGLEDFFMEYTVLARHISNTVCLWVDFMAEVTSILEKDYDDIRRVFFDGGVPGKVISIEMGLSDYHNNNKTVVKLTFENQKSIIFKPRNMGIEKAYYKLLDYLNGKMCKIPQRILKILDGKTYGWIEFVEYLHCNTIDQVKNYYKRSGALLSIMYVFCGTDLHLENIIASGDTPVLIDLEMLMNNNYCTSNIKSCLTIDDVLGKRFSALYTGLLPVLYENYDGTMSDLSGLGGETDVETTLKEPIFENINTDSMHVEFKHIKKLSYKNIVKLQEKPVNPVNFVDEITEGFEEMYMTLIELKDELLQENSDIDLFSHQLLRYVFRETKNYYQIIRNSLNTKFIRDGMDWSLGIDSSFSTLHAGAEPIAEILKYEHQAINKLDVPYISYWSDSKELSLSSNTRINNYFFKTSFDILKDNISGLNKDDMENQIGIIKSSYKILTKMKKSACDALDISHVVPCSKTCLGQGYFAKEAKKIAEEIMKNRIESYGCVNWIQIIESTNTYSMKMMEYGLYNGKLGIGIFLAAISKLSCNTYYDDTVCKIFKPYKDYFAGGQFLSLHKNMNLGIASGLGGEYILLFYQANF